MVNHYVDTCCSRISLPVYMRSGLRFLIKKSVEKLVTLSLQGVYNFLNVVLVFIEWLEFKFSC